MTQETYDAMYALNCPECPYNHFDGEYNRCQLKNIVHHIFKSKPRWCPYKGKSDETEKSENHETPGDPKE